jgi:hypothetical protein
MSVIQDALKRKLEEQKASRAATPPSRQGQPPPPQAPPIAHQVLQYEAAARPAPAPPEPTHDYGAVARDQQRTIWMLIVSILVILTAGMIGAFLYFMASGRSEMAGGTPGETRPNPDGVSVLYAEPAALVPQPFQHVPEPVPRAGPVAVVTPPAGSPDALSVAAPTRVTTGTPPAEAPEATPGVAAIPGQWPMIEIDGVLSGGDAKRNSAILNGNVIRVNRKLDGVRLTEVSEEGVVLEYNGKQKYVEIGGTTYD